jgi:hypothetical protein
MMSVTGAPSPQAGPELHVGFVAQLLFDHRQRAW